MRSQYARKITSSPSARNARDSPVGSVIGSDQPYADQGPLRHRLLRTAQLAPSGDAVQGRVLLMGNDDVTISVARPQQPMTYWYRYAHGDEAIFIHEGTGTLESQFGTLRYGRGDYLVIPTGVIWRILPDSGVDQRMLIVEIAGGHIEPPTRYINSSGQFLESAPYSGRDIRPPEDLVTHDEKGEFEVWVKARGNIARYLYAHHPLDVVGWDGHLWPFAFNIGDFEPITGRVHQPPPVHQTFEGPGFVVCSFVPRLFDYHPLRGRHVPDELAEIVEAVTVPAADSGRSASSPGRFPQA